MGAASLADMIIALSMCWCLWHKRTGYQRTDSIICPCIILYQFRPVNKYPRYRHARQLHCRALCLINEAFFWALGKCYVNSFLAILNSRNSLRDRSPDNTDGSFHMTPSDKLNRLS
ncbi:hypothetical protein BC826DRAFT_603784 [Russula brevipes]|nr:hypothetical protein BC826DRAFT_603784 [Russula brevipes]